MTIQELQRRSDKLKLELRQIIKRGDASNDVKELQAITQEVIVAHAKLDDANDQLLEARMASNGVLDDDGQSERTRTINDAEQRQREGQQIQKSNQYTPGVGFNAIDSSFASGNENINLRGEGKMDMKELNTKYEQRAADLKAGKAAVFSAQDMQELRAITVGSSNIVTSSVSSPNLVPGQLQVASIVDRVYNMPLQGAESFKQGYEILTNDAGITAEGADSLDATPIFGYSDINKLRLTSYSEITSEIQKLSPVQYSAFVMEAMQNSIRKVISKQIVAGAGGTAGFNGIVNATVASGLVNEIDIATIDGTTLDKIVFGGFGGELAMGVGTLILQKADLAAFAAIRNSIGVPIYKIEFEGGNPNAGFISSNESYKVPYLITDQLSPLSNAATAVGTVSLLYGDLKKYMLVVFSSIDVRMSQDFQFKNGNTCFKGECYAGGNIVGYQAFSKIVKSAS